MKVLMYLWVVASEDVETQRKGLIIISYSGPKITNDNCNSEQQKFHSNRVKTHAIVAYAVPMRVSAIHLCFSSNSSLFVVLTKIYSAAIGVLSTRVKLHLGQPIEIRYHLKSYGIPVEMIPATDTGNVKHANLKHWINVRRILEKFPISSRRGSMSSNSSDDTELDFENTSSIIQHGYLPQQQQRTQQYQQMQYPHFQTQQQQQIYQQQQQQYPIIVECPGSNDVIFRRGKSMTYHPGNNMFQGLIESRLEEYTEATQAEKMAIVLALIQQIEKEKGGRFLTWDSKNNWWLNMMTIPMSGTHNSPGGLFTAQELEIQSKVSYAFRDCRKKLASRQRLQVSRSSTFAFERQDGVKKKRIKSGRESTSCIERHFCSDNESAGFSDGSI